MDKIIFNKTNEKNTINVQVTHPEFGYVQFNSISPRQADILSSYNLLLINKKRNETKNKIENNSM
jgi:hypothetical protein